MISNNHFPPFLTSPPPIPAQSPSISPISLIFRLNPPSQTCAPCLVCRPCAPTRRHFTHIARPQHLGLRRRKKGNIPHYLEKGRLRLRGRRTAWRGLRVSDRDTLEIGRKSWCCAVLLRADCYMDRYAGIGKRLEGQDKWITRGGIRGSIHKQCLLSEWRIEV